MKIVCLGDSLTQGDYGDFGKRCIPNVHPENYPYFLSEILNCEVVNYGKCGFTSSDFINFYNSGAVDVKGADIIIIMLGTNGGLDPEEARRVIDFIAGTVYGVNGDIQKISGGIFIATPSSYDITGEFLKDKSGAGFDWSMFK